MEMNTDQRENLRREVHIHVEVHALGGILVEGATHDISMSGLNMASERFLPVGKQCDIVLLLCSHDTHSRLTLTGRIARADEGGMSIVFDQLNEDNAISLRYFLENLSEFEQIEMETGARYT